MDRQEALKRLEEIKTPSLFGDFVGYYGARDLIDELYQTPLYLRDVVTDGNHLYLKEYKDVGIIAISNKISESTRYIKKFENKDEAQKVADVLGWKVQEVQDDTEI